MKPTWNIHEMYMLESDNNGYVCFRICGLGFKNVPFYSTKRALFVVKTYRFCLKGGSFCCYVSLMYVLCRFHVCYMYV